MVPHPTIELEAGYGPCPRCKRPVLSLDREECLFCGQDLETLADQDPPLLAALASILPGWNPARVRAWIAPRPAQVAWAMTQQAWPCLQGWVEEALWRQWESAERHRRESGQALRMGEVSLSRIAIRTADAEGSRIQVALRGLRSAYVVDTRTRMAVSGLRGARPFGELWTLQATGHDDPAPVEHCHSCGAPAELDTYRCSRCASWMVSRPGPWKVTAVEALEPSAPRRRAPMEDRPVYTFLSRPGESTLEQLVMEYLGY